MGRDHDPDAVVENGRFVGGGGGLPLDDGIGFDHQRLDLIGQLNRNGPLLPGFHHHIHAVLQEGSSLPQQVARQLDLVVIFLVHEGQLIPLGEQELEIAGVEPDLFDRFGGTEPLIALAAINQVLELDLHIGPALPRLGVLDFHRAPQAAFIFNDVAGTNLDAADLHGNLP